MILTLSSPRKLCLFLTSQIRLFRWLLTLYLETVDAQVYSETNHHQYYPQNQSWFSLNPSTTLTQQVWTEKPKSQWWDLGGLVENLRVYAVIIHHTTLLSAAHVTVTLNSLITPMFAPCHILLNCRHSLSTFIYKVILCERVSKVVRYFPKHVRLKLLLSSGQGTLHLWHKQFHIKNSMLIKQCVSGWSAMTTGVHIFVCDKTQHLRTQCVSLMEGIFLQQEAAAA